jgi:ketosteroid isomerase-like protein
VSDEENVATARRFAEALESGDMKAAATALAPNVQIDDRDIPDSDGHDSFYGWIGRWNEVFDGWRTEETRLLAADDKVLSLFRMFATGRGSGIELERDDALLLEFEAGKIRRIGYYNDQAEALAASGIERDYEP